MTKFGELIDNTVPVLIEFYAKDHKKSSSYHSILTTVAQEMKDKTKVVRIDIDKNKKLSEALKIEELPTLVIYKNGEMVWRKTGLLQAENLIKEINNYI